MQIYLELYPVMATQYAIKKMMTMSREMSTSTSEPPIPPLDTRCSMPQFETVEGFYGGQMPSLKEFAFIVILFVVFTPGILFSFPPGSTKIVKGIVHGILFTGVLKYTFKK